MPFNFFPYMNQHSLNIEWAIQKIKELVAEGEALYAELRDWRTETDTALNDWKTATLGDLEDWKTATIADLEDWKTQTGSDLADALAQEIETFETWWTNNRTDLEDLVAQAGTAATTATAALARISEIYAEILYYTKYVSLADGVASKSFLNLGTILRDAYTVFERNGNSISINGECQPATGSNYYVNVVGNGEVALQTQLTGSRYVYVTPGHFYRVAYQQISGTYSVTGGTSGPMLRVFTVDDSTNPATVTSIGGIVPINGNIMVQIPDGITKIFVGTVARFSTGNGTVVTYTNFVANIYVGDVTDLIEDTVTNVLVVGNSFSQDAVAYAGKIMTDAGAPIRLYCVYRSGTSANEYLGHTDVNHWGDYYVYTNMWDPFATAWKRTYTKSLDDVLAMHKWHIVYAQFTVGEGTDVISPFFDYLQENLTDFIFVSGGQLDRSSDTLQARITALAEAGIAYGNVEKWCYGTYAYRACADTPALWTIPNIQHPDRPWGIYEDSGETMHQMAGLPALINNYAFCELIYRTAHLPISVMGSAWIPTTANAAAISASIMTHGDSVGADASYCRMAQKAVMAAFKWPYKVPIWDSVHNTYVEPSTP